MWQIEPAHSNVREPSQIAARAPDHCRHDFLLLREFAWSKGRIVPRMRGVARLRQWPAGSLPLWHGEAHLCPVPDPLLRGPAARTHQSGHTLRWSAHALAASHPGDLPSVGWPSAGARVSQTGSARACGYEGPIVFRTNSLPGSCFSNRFISRLSNATATAEAGRPLR